MNTDEVIDLIVERVLEKLKQREKQALIIFNGSFTGLKESLIQLKKMQERNWKLKVVLSKSAGHLLDPDHLKKELSVQEICIEGRDKNLQSLDKDYSLLIMPTLTKNSAAKISLGIADNLTTSLVSRFIMRGLPIIAAKDACLPEERKKTPSDYLNMFENYLDKLERFGLKLVKTDEIFQTVSENEPGPVHRFFPETAVKPGPQHIRGKKVVTQSDILDAIDTGRVLNVQAKAIITPLAMETANDAGVKIVRLGE
ncbi:flavoprotein [Thermoactinomyces mirandus]|uniref:Flavoprotein domain-containing protein n=1 Tax=Thermoactinomyces mirandus TaxID=2756294 RepID=A0A7W1XU71_9BACL|nr:flavoprotein [Thermoactinomyces mirandus]MBA4603268.1 hypothetical protein [Thermoactinomyces mirandus]